MSNCLHCHRPITSTTGECFYCSPITAITPFNETSYTRTKVQWSEELKPLPHPTYIDTTDRHQEFLLTERCNALQRRIDEMAEMLIRYHSKL